MKEYLLNNMEVIITLITMILTIILGGISKKSKFVNTNLIPIQNLCVGLVIAVIYFAITKDFNSAIALSGITAGGTYDIIHNIAKMKKAEQDELEYGDEGEQDEL